MAPEQIPEPWCGLEKICEPAGGKSVPIDHMAYEPVLLLKGEEATKMLLCHFRLIKATPDKNVKTGIPEELIWITLGGRTGEMEIWLPLASSRFHVVHQQLVYTLR